MNKKAIKILLAIFAVVIIIWLVFFNVENIDQYKTQKVSNASVSKEIDFSAYWYPQSYTKITIGSIQDVIEMNAKEGAWVKTSDVLFRLRDDSEYNQFKAAQASYYAAAAAKKSAQQGTVVSIPAIPGVTGVPSSVSIPSTVSLSQIQSQINAAYYQMKNAELSLNKKKVYAPLNGRIVSIYMGDRNVSSSSSFSVPTSLTGMSALSGGSSSSSTGNYIIMVDDNDPSIKVTFSEQEVAQIKDGMTVKLRSRVLENEISGVVNHVTRTPTASSTVESPSYEVLITLKEYLKEVPYGGKLEGSIITAAKENVPTVSFDAVTVDSVKKGSVLVLRNGVAVRVPVELGVIGENNVEIISGLNNDDEIIIDKAAPKQIITFKPWLKNLFKKQ